MEENELKSNSVESDTTNDKLLVVVPKGEKSFWAKVAAGSIVTMCIISAVGAMSERFEDSLRLSCDRSFIDLWYARLDRNDYWCYYPPQSWLG